MAKISFEMDTVEKIYSLTLDGKAITNVSSLSAYMDYPYDNDGDGDEDDKCGITITTRTRDEEEGLCHYTQIMASEKEGVVVKEVEKKPEDKSVNKHIADFLNQKREERRSRKHTGR